MINEESPWGSIQSEESVAPGLTRVTTAAHGGIYVDEERLVKIPLYMRWPGGWYEEDCDWAIPFAVFENQIRESGPEADVKALDSGLHLRILALEYPEIYKRFFGVAERGADV